MVWWIGSIHNLCVNFDVHLFLQKLYGEFELMGVPEQKLCSQHWQNVHQRMQTEEAACQLAGGEAEENGCVLLFLLRIPCCVNQLETISLKNITFAPLQLFFTILLACKIQIPAPKKAVFAKIMREVLWKITEMGQMCYSLEKSSLEICKLHFSKYFEVRAFINPQIKTIFLFEISFRWWRSLLSKMIDLN